MGALTAWALAQRGDTVLIVDWEGEAGARLESKLRAAGYAAHFLLANLAEKDEVEALATRVKSRWPRLELLLCNAGITYPEFQQNRAGVDMHLAACHLGHFLLLHRLRPCLAASGHARVIFVASEGHQACQRLDQEHANGAHFWAGRRLSHAAAFKAYARAKLAMLLCLPVWAEKLAAQNIQVAAISPGYFVNTGIHRDMRGIFRIGAALIFGLGQLLRLSTAKRGARAHILLSTMPAEHFPHGQYWNHKGPLQRSPVALQPELQDAAFRWSASIVGLTAAPNSPPGTQ